MRPIIDAHAHVYPDKIAEKATKSVGNFYSLPMSNNVGSVTALLQSGKKAGIERFVICSVATAPSQTTIINHFLAEVCQQYPENFVGLGAMHPLSPEPEKDLQLIKEIGLKGAKLHPDFQQFDIDDPKLFPIYDMLSETGLPLLMHTGDKRFSFSHPSRLVRILKLFPRMTVVAAHMGGWSVWDEALDILRNENCYVDTSSTMLFMGPQKMKDMINTYGEERVLFGVDFPMWNHEEELQLLEKLNLKPHQLDCILYKNAEKILW